MSKVYEGDEWKNPKPERSGPEKPPTRAQEQARINLLYGHGKITQAQWRKRTDELSDPNKWTGSGRVKIEEP